MAHSPSDASNDAKVANEDGLILTAIMNNDKHYLVELLAQGCSPIGDESKPEVSTPLDLAINLQNLEMVKILLRYGACIKSTVCTLNPTAMHCAVLNRQKAVIRQLIKNKVDWKTSDGNGATVLHMVFELEDTALEEEEEDGDEDDDEAEVRPPRSKIAKTEFSLEQEIIEIITIFLNLGANVNAEMNSGETPLFLALKKGMIEVAGFLIERGANVHARDNMGNSLIHLLINDEVDEPDFDEDNEEALESFAQKNNATFINWLLSKGLNANYKNARGEIPLQLAIDYKLRDTLLVLLKHANVYFVNEEAESWLHVFVKMYQPARAEQATTSTPAEVEFLTISEIDDIVRDLIRRGVPVNGVDCYGQTLFHAAIQLRNAKILKAIAERFVNVLACNSEGESVLHALISRCIDDERQNEEGYAEVARILISKGANPNRKDKRGMSAVHLAAQYKYARILRVFRDGGADLRSCTDDGDSLLHIAAGRLSSLLDELADKTLVELALEQGCDVNQVKPKGQWTALHIAASSGNTQVAKSLLQHGAKLDCRNEDRYTPLHMAAMKDDREMVELLAGKGADVNARSRDTSTPLHLATKSAALKVIECLIEHGANLHYCSEEFATPLHLAALGHCEKTLQLLVRSGADVNAKSRDGASPLLWMLRHCSGQNAKMGVLEKLIELGADVNRKDPRDGSSAMHVAVRRKHSRQLFRLLARHGVDVDARQSSTGDTPLHEAARTCSMEDHAIATLLELGARTRLTNFAGLAPLDLAIVSDCSAGFCQLLKFGVSIADIPRSIRPLVLASPELSSHMVAHLAKLQSANLPTHGYCQAYAGSSSTSSSSTSFESQEPSISLHLGFNSEKFEREVEALKAHTIADDQVSLYDLLHMQPHQQFSYLKNKTLDLADIEAKYSNYHGFIWRLSLEARERKLLMEPAKRALKELSNVRLPDICAQCIFNYLNNDCLKDIIDAARNR